MTSNLAGGTGHQNATAALVEERVELGRRSNRLKASAVISKDLWHYRLGRNTKMRGNGRLNEALPLVSHGSAGYQGEEALGTNMVVAFARLSVLRDRR
jgi:hypothetical protein